MFKKVLIGTTVLLLFTIVAEAVYLFVFKTKATTETATVAKTASDVSTASTPSSSRETEQDTLKVNKILGIYLSSASPMFAAGEIRTTLQGYLVKQPQLEQESITFEMNTMSTGNENSTIKAYFENTKFVDENGKPIDYHTIKQGDQMSVVYIYNYKGSRLAH
ncbi:hypothetical protein IPM65_02560 [Candidatus Roizmanbacteria bacterium]|nr:MAG: hypothetical protein IPM65_02560 [Candidatus Roizmanbacteria bacterium]